MVQHLSLLESVEKSGKLGHQVGLHDLKLGEPSFGFPMMGQAMVGTHIQIGRPETEGNLEGCNAG